MLIMIVMQFIVFLFGFFGHGNALKKTGDTSFGLWKYCNDGDCASIEDTMFSDGWFCHLNIHFALCSLYQTRLPSAI